MRLTASSPSLAALSSSLQTNPTDPFTSVNRISSDTFVHSSATSPPPSLKFGWDQHTALATLLLGVVTMVPWFWSKGPERTVTHGKLKKPPKDSHDNSATASD